MWAITTDSLSSVRTFLFSKFTWMQSFYITIRNTYSDDIISEQIGYQFNINGKSIFQIIGTGSDPNRDPGYVQMLHSIGIFGTLMCVIPYIVIAYRSYEESRYIPFCINQIVFLSLAFIAIYELIFNFKLLFLFSTGAFELLYVFYLISKMVRDRGNYNG